MTEPMDLVKGRSCDGCTLCCKLPSLEDVGKARNEWCRHCNPKTGCTIYNQRPQICRDFHCGYLYISALSEDWKPSKCKLFVAFEQSANRVVIHVDPARPDGWLKEPYYSHIKWWSKEVAREQGQVIVWIGNRTIAVLPDRDIDLGHVRQDQFIITQQKPGPHGIQLDVVVMDSDDPRLANVLIRHPSKE